FMSLLRLALQRNMESLYPIRWIGGSLEMVLGTGASMIRLSGISFVVLLLASPAPAADATAVGRADPACAGGGDPYRD
ncbi:hypothetical protein, partial [Klebsiella aerogenes]|uniref:hypothetical protein n=1 Tax=Klebsiella aerogenes TaxID=548 RepID=UPI001954223F